MKQRRARPVFASSRRLSRKRLGSIFRFRPFSHASSRRLSRKRLGSIEKAVLSPPTGPLAGTQEAVLSPPTGPLATGPLAGAQEAVLSPPTGPLAGRHLFRVISSATAFHNLIRDQKSPEGALPGTPPESLTSLSDPVKQVCEAASRTPCLPLSDLQQRFKLSDLPQRFQHALGCLLWRAPPSTGGVGGLWGVGRRCGIGEWCAWCFLFIFGEFVMKKCRHHLHHKSVRVGQRYLFLHVVQVYIVYIIYVYILERERERLLDVQFSNWSDTSVSESRSRNGPPVQDPGAGAKCWPGRLRRRSPIGGLGSVGETTRTADDRAPKSTSGASGGSLNGCEW